MILGDMDGEEKVYQIEEVKARARFNLDFTSTIHHPSPYFRRNSDYKIQSP
jgi:hypothetical protein